VRIIDVAIAKDPDHRYSDLNLMVTALEEEVLPAVPLPHLITPITGVPAQTFRDALAGQSVVQAILRKEPSGQYQETRVLYGFSLEKPNRSAREGEAGGANEADQKAAASAPPSSRETVLVRFTRGRELLRIRSLAALRIWSEFALRPWLRSALRRRRELVSAGIAVALVFAVWMVIRGPGRQQTAKPSPATKVTHTASTLAPTTSPPSLGVGLAAQAELAAPDPARAAHVPLQSPPAGLAAQDVAKGSPQRRPGHGLAKAETSARAASDHSAGKPGRPRSGNLSEDDF
jgi:hypothetical protein